MISPRRRALAALAMVTVVALTGCEEDTNTTSSPTTEGTSSSTSTPPPESASPTPGDGPSTPSDTPPSTTQDPQVADVDEYRVGDGVYFSSPTGKIRCGESAGMYGCQFSGVIESMPECDDPASNAPMVWADEQGRITAECTNQGIFVQPEMKELPYGSVLPVDDMKFISATDGVTLETPQGTGFTIAAEGITIR